MFIEAQYTLPRPSSSACFPEAILSKGRPTGIFKPI